MKFRVQGLDESVHVRVTTAHPNHDKELASETTASNERTSNTPESEKQDEATLTGGEKKTSSLVQRFGTAKSYTVVHICT